IEQRHLDILCERTPESDRPRLKLLCASFPDLAVEPNSISATLVARLLHFLDGETIERSALKLREWIAPGGKVFVVSETPFVGTLTSFTEEYLRRKGEGDPWPGLIADMHAHHPRASALPKLGNWLDVDVLTRVFSSAGFKIEECSFFARPEFPDWLQLD